MALEFRKKGKREKRKKGSREGRKSKLYIFIQVNFKVYLFSCPCFYIFCSGMHYLMTNENIFLNIKLRKLTKKSKL